jgi:hypothetical protein
LKIQNDNSNGIIEEMKVEQIENVLLISNKIGKHVHSSLSLEGITLR